VFEEQQLSNKSCPLFKSTLPVYFVGILSTLIDVEHYGWLDLNNFNSDTSMTGGEFEKFKLNLESSPSSLSKEKVISSSASSQKLSQKKGLNDSSTSNGSSQPTQVERRIEHMNTYLKNVFFTLSLNQANLDGLIAIYELLKLVILLF
jgi:hypothetical protein